VGWTRITHRDRAGFTVVGARDNQNVEPPISNKFRLAQFLFFFVLISGGRDSSVGIATRLWAGRPRNRGSIPRQGQETFLHNVQTGSGAHPASYTMGTGALLPRG
jgi:hypothetical protein